MATNGHPVSGRRELKYFFGPQDCLRLMRFLEPHVKPDRWTNPGQTSYSVHSLYLDSAELTFYHEKLAGIRVRKKLRIRGYDHSDKHRDVFLEIKRKYGEIISKDRAKTKLRYIGRILESGRPQGTIASLESQHMQAIGKFLHNIRAMSLRPTVLVTYDRQAFVGRNESYARVTFDRNVRCIFKPTIDNLFAESDWCSCDGSGVIVEFKFEGSMPWWMRRIVRQFGMVPQAISKYCMAVDAVCDPVWDKERRLQRSYLEVQNGV
jgi:hypothetical protein